MSAPELRMTEGEAVRLQLLLDARLRDYRALHATIDRRHPGEISRPTIWRYLQAPPKKLDMRVVELIAEAVGRDALTVYAALREDRATRAYFNGWVTSSPHSVDLLVGVG